MFEIDRVIHDTEIRLCAGNISLYFKRWCFWMQSFLVQQKRDGSVNQIIILLGRHRDNKIFFYFICLLVQYTVEQVLTFLIGHNLLCIRLKDIRGNQKVFDASTDFGWSHKVLPIIMRHDSWLLVKNKYNNEQFSETCRTRIFIDQLQWRF